MKEIKELNTALNQMYRRQNDIYHAYAVHYGLSDTAFWILYTLCESEEIYTQNDLAQQWYFPRQSINSATASLVKAGYLCLEQLAKAKNHKALRLTKEGESFIEYAIKPFFTLEERVLSRISESEREQFVSSCGRLCDLLEEEVNAIISGGQS